MVTIEWAGTVDYLAAWERQKRLVAGRLATEDSLSANGDRLLLLEHPPTYTLGRSGRLENLLWSEEKVARRGIAVYWVDRGGDITYHGPGQLVGYPILNLKELHRAHGLARPDLHRYLRDVEACLIQVLAGFDIVGWRYPGYTGVWVTAADGEPRKIAAIGVKVSAQGISSHGFALNVAPDLSHYGGIIPCGIQEHGVTSMAERLQRPIKVADVLPAVATAFGRVFELDVTFVTTGQSEYNERET